MLISVQQYSSITRVPGPRDIRVGPKAVEPASVACAFSSTLQGMAKTPYRSALVGGARLQGSSGSSKAENRRIPPRRNARYTPVYSRAYRCCCCLSMLLVVLLLLLPEGICRNSKSTTTLIECDHSQQNITTELAAGQPARNNRSGDNSYATRHSYPATNAPRCIKQYVRVLVRLRKAHLLVRS